MTFYNQFSLSLELNRLLPLKLAASKAAEAVMSLARDLQVSKCKLVTITELKALRSENSGSDIVVEEDLAEMFGRCRIASNMESSFRTCVAAAGHSYPLCEGIMLQNSAGPIVARCLLRGQTAYFATVLQCSLLTSVSVTL